MQEPTGDPTLGRRLRYRTLILVAFALGLAVVSAFGVLDRLGQGFVAATTAESIGILLVSMGFDAGISALQDLPIVGAGLDPINDAVERLSMVIVWAIGSLLLQRTALELVSSAAFQWGFVAICAVVVPLLLLLERRRSGDRSSIGVERYRGWLVRVLVVAAMVRFFVPAFLAASATVSNVVLQPEIEEHRATLEALSTEIFGGEETIVDDQETPGEQATAPQVADQQNEAAPADGETPETASADADGAEPAPEDREAAGPAPGDQDAAGPAPEDQDAAGPAPGDQEAAGPAPEDQGGFLGGLLGGVSAAQDAALDLLSGVSLPEIPDVILPEMPDLATIQAMAGEAMELLSRLLVAIAIKNIALPLVFLWIAVKAAAPLARWLIGLGTDDAEDSREPTIG